VEEGEYIRVVCESLEKTVRRWVSGTTAGDLQHRTGPSIKLLFWVMLSVPRCLMVRAVGFPASCSGSQRNPTGLE